MSVKENESDLYSVLSGIENVGEYLTSMSAMSSGSEDVRRKMTARRLKTEITILQSFLDELERER